MVQIPRWQSILVLIVLVMGLIYSLPNVLPKSETWPDWIPGVVPNKQVHLGLDLQGGSHLLVEVDHQRAYRQRLEDLVGGVRSEMARLRNDGVLYRNLGITGDQVGFELLDPAHLDQAREAALRVSGGFNLTVEDGSKIVIGLDEDGYREVKSPQLLDSKLWEMSGHWGKFRENMFVVPDAIPSTDDDEPVLQVESDLMALKPISTMRSNV